MGYVGDRGGADACMKADTDCRLAGMQAQASERAAFKERNGEGGEGKGEEGREGGEGEVRRRGGREMVPCRS